VEKMAKLVIDRALHGNVANTWPRWEEMLGLGSASGFTAAPKAASRQVTASTPPLSAAAQTDRAGAKVR
jgi:hypothetical protein